MEECNDTCIPKRAFLIVVPKGIRSWCGVYLLSTIMAELEVLKNITLEKGESCITLLWYQSHNCFLLLFIPWSVFCLMIRHLIQANQLYTRLSLMRYFNISDVGSVSFAVCIRMTLSAVLSERSCPGFYIGMLLYSVGGGKRCRSKTRIYRLWLIECLPSI